MMLFENVILNYKLCDSNKMFLNRIEDSKKVKTMYNLLYVPVFFGNYEVQQKTISRLGPVNNRHLI